MMIAGNMAEQWTSQLVSKKTNEEFSADGQ